MEVVTDKASARDRFPYPRGSVVGGLADAAASTAGRERLESAGFGSTQYEVLHGASDADRIDVTGEGHGRLGKIARKLQDAATDEGESARRYADYLRHGHYLISVDVGDDEAAEERAAEALRGADSEFLTYYADAYIEELAVKA